MTPDLLGRSTTDTLKEKKMLKIFVDSLNPEILFPNLDNSFSMALRLISGLGMLPPTVLGQEMLNYLGKVRQG